MLDAMIAGFDTDAFCGFLRSKFPSFSESRRPLKVGQTFLSAQGEADIPVCDSGHAQTGMSASPWDSAEQIGIVKTLAGPNGLNMPLLVVVATLPEGDPLRERSSRLRQFTFARKVLGQVMAAPSPGIEGVITQGLFVFHDDDGNFRLSLVFGKAEGTKLVWSTARRLSFHVEAGAGNKTFRDRMALPWASFDKLKEAFSVEKLTKEFYNRLFAWYQWALSDEMNVTYPNNPDSDADDREINEHIIRLITRLMFVWFLKQKHLVPDNLFDPAELSRNLKTFSPVSGDNYYRAILQNLFFATLNSEISERAFAVDAGNIRENKEHFGIKTLYRYGSEFTMGEDKVLALFRSIPFLNGGLFECLDKEQSYVDGFSRNPKKQAHVPNRLFFDADKGMIPLLEQYNFTVEENSPGDEEVALDPELLGKVFENLLGAYNPETKVAARNATGSFYTPREIVNYMVDESLKAHVLERLTTEHTEDTEREKGKDSRRGAETQRDEAVKQLFENGERPEDETLCRQIDTALVTAKILDPACGSGAFPMGILLRMVELLRVLRQIPDDDHDAIYDLKLQLIENCIYGGDIQCIAVQISKLRFFISLVCEQKPTSNSTKNYGIHTLPNLETKFVAADSLIGLPRSGDILPMQDVEALKKELWAVRHKHFTARSYREKKELRKEDKRLRTALAKALELGGGFDTESARLMAGWDPYDQNTSAPFSDPEWMFNVKDGFDLVIGNPPYIQLQENGGFLADLYEPCGYSTFGRTSDIYCLFYEQGFRLLCTSGHLCYITSNQWMRTAYGKKLRQFFCDQIRPIKLLDMGEGVFDATTNTNILLAEKGKSFSAFPAAAVTDKSAVDCDAELAWITLAPTNAPWIVSSGPEQSVMAKITSGGIPLKDWDIQINYGVKTAFNLGFIIDGGARVRIISQDAKSDEVIKPLLIGHNIKRFKVLPEDLWLINTHNGYGNVPAININDYPAIKAHLDRMEHARASGAFGEKAKKAKGLFRRDDQGRTPYNLRNCAYVPEFEKEKITWGNLCQSAQFALVEAGVYINAPAPIITPANRYLLAVLNSKLGDFFIRSLGVIRSGGYFEYKPMFVEQLPVPIISKSDQKPFENLVNRILAAKKVDPDADTSAWEAEIDRLVYELYGLTEEEIAIVEASVVEKSADRGRKSSASTEATADKENEDQGDEAEEPPVAKRKKKPAPRKLKANLPPSLPGWD